MTDFNGSLKSAQIHPSTSSFSFTSSCDATLSYPLLFALNGACIHGELHPKGVDDTKSVADAYLQQAGDLCSCASPAWGLSGKRYLPKVSCV